MRRYLALAIALAACRTARAPTVMLHLVDPPRWSSHERNLVAAVGSIWADLGLDFEVTDKPERTDRPCPRDWAARGVTDCVIDVGLSKRDGMRTRDGVTGLSDRTTGESQIDSTIEGATLLHTLAHEIGHQVLNTGEHVAAPGVMASGSVDWSVSPADLELACRQIQRGCR